LNSTKGHGRKTGGYGKREESFYFHFRGFGVINLKGLWEQGHWWIGKVGKGLS
jgi:hypothetical protein